MIQCKIKKNTIQIVVYKASHSIRIKDPIINLVVRRGTVLERVFVYSYSRSYNSLNYFLSN